MGNTADVSLIRKAIINYTCVRGDTFAPPPVSFTINGTPEDFSASTLRMQLRSSANRVMKELTNGDGIAVAANVLQYSISAADMEDWAYGQYRYDVQKTTAGIAVTILSGTLKLLEDITQ